ncbi:MAG: XRE family transcriptional regulator [Ferruginibacter sp.]
MTHTDHSRSSRVHEGRNIKRFREMLGIKQDALAANLGDDWNQQKSPYSSKRKPYIPAILAQVSTILKIPVEAFQNFDEDQAVNVIANTFHNADSTIGFVINNHIRLIKLSSSRKKRLLYTSVCSKKKMR